MIMAYNHRKTEEKWRTYWETNKTFKTNVWDFSKPKYYVLDMFPYPSGAGLHVGHPEDYTATDIVSRKKRMEGYNVLHPMGFDSFGLPAEQYAINTGNHPDQFTKNNIEIFTKQLKNIGFSYDWDRVVSTCDPSFYKWTQFIFKLLFEDGLAKCVDMPVNWCEELGTVLANDEVIDGKSERGGYPVVRKNMKQWVIDIVAYAERLLEGLEEIDWPESTKEMQRNWIGKSIGAHVIFKIDGHEESFTVFTTRSDTLFGATYCVLAPEHKLVEQITTPEQKAAVEEYVRICSTKSDLERTELNKEDAIAAMTAWLEEKGLGEKKVNYRIREWIFARQRYWGEPIPIIHFENDELVALRLEDLPLILPELDDYKPSASGASPLEKATDWVNVEYDGRKGKRETSTMPGSAGSSWYFLRYIDPDNDNMIADPKLLEHWLPVDLYVGGPEHAVGHLLYSRMWNNFLYDKGYVPVKEPFHKLVHQGMILGANGIKMGKRYPEYIVDPNVIVDRYGADTLRLYEMFMGPLEASKPWSEQGVEGARRWIERVWRLCMETPEKITEEATPELDYVYNCTIKKVTEDIDTLNFNTAISQMMIFINDCYKADRVNRDMIINFIKVLSPFTPHVCEEIYHHYTGEETLAYTAWPAYDPEKLEMNAVTIVVQVNGKVRTKFDIRKDEDKAVVEETALAQEALKPFLEGKTVRKVIVVPNKIVNIVAN